MSTKFFAVVNYTNSNNSSMNEILLPNANRDFDSIVLTEQLPQGYVHAHV